MVPNMLKVLSFFLVFLVIVFKVESAPIWKIKTTHVRDCSTGLELAPRRLRNNAKVRFGSFMSWQGWTSWELPETFQFMFGKQVDGQWLFLQRSEDNRLVLKQGVPPSLSVNRTDSRLFNYRLQHQSNSKVLMQFVSHLQLYVAAKRSSKNLFLSADESKTVSICLD